MVDINRKQIYYSLWKKQKKKKEREKVVQTMKDKTFHGVG